MVVTVYVRLENCWGEWVLMLVAMVGKRGQEICCEHANCKNPEPLVFHVFRE